MPEPVSQPEQGKPGEGPQDGPGAVVRAGKGRGTELRLVVVVFVDVADSSELVGPGRLGPERYAELARKHERIVRGAVERCGGREIRRQGDGFDLWFESATAAVEAALLVQYAELTDPAFSGDGDPKRSFRLRIGIHQGEVMIDWDAIEAGQPTLRGMALNEAGRIQSAALPGQVLMSKAVADGARPYMAGHPEVGAAEGAGAGIQPLVFWKDHGEYRLKGLDAPVSLWEAGAAGVGPGVPPPSTADKKVLYIGSVEDEAMRGWRPGPGQEIPGKQGDWRLERKLGEGGFGEVWLTRSAKLREARVFKFCFDAGRIRGLRREVTIFELLKATLSERRDIARLYGFQFESPPFFLESEYTDLGDLLTWSAGRGGISAVPMAERLELVAQVAAAVAAAHGVGVLHKDLKPANVLMFRGEGGEVRPRLADFGIGVVTNRALLDDHKISKSGLTVGQLTENQSSRTGTRLYAPPEMDAGKAFTAKGDVYALGVLLYQVVVGDFERPLGVGWERGVEDSLLRELIAAMVDVDAERRMDSAGAVVAGLRGLEQRRTERAKAAAEARRGEEELRRAGRRKRAAVWGAVVGAAGVIVAAAAVLLAVEFGRKEEAARKAEGRATAAAEKAAAAEKKATAEAERATQLAESEKGLREEAERQSYTANVQMAEAWVGLKEYARARERLDSCPPGRRGWEWGWLNAELNANLAELKGHTQWVNSAAFSPDGRRIVTASNDNTARVWDAATGVSGAELKGHPESVTSAAFSPDGSRIVTTSHDNTARVWDAATRESYPQQYGHTLRYN
ncbi:MAG: protein kinase domain-containing protein, partial [Phycisphaerales bacterium]